MKKGLSILSAVGMVLFGIIAVLFLFAACLSAYYRGIGPVTYVIWSFLIVFAILATVNAIGYICADLENRKKSGLMALGISWAISCIIIVLTVLIPNPRVKEFNNLKTGVDGSCFQVINEGTHSSGSYTTELVNVDGIVVRDTEVIDKSIGQTRRMGFRYTAIKEGDVNILVLCGAGGGNIHDLTVYKLHVDKNLQISYESVVVGQTNYKEKIYNKEVIEKSRPVLVEEYGFSEEAIEEFFSFYCVE